MIYALLPTQGQNIGHKTVGGLVQEVIKYNHSLKIIKVAHGGATIGKIQIRKKDILVTIDSGYRGLFTLKGELVMEKGAAYVPSKEQEG